MQIPPIQLDSCKIKTFSIQKCRYSFKKIFNSDENVRIFSVYVFGSNDINIFL